MTTTELFDEWKAGKTDQQKKAFKEILDKNNIEFNRYKQDCRKRALDLAHSQLTGHNWQQFIKGNEFVKTDGVKEEKVVIEDTMLTAVADKYYKWLIQIPS